MTNARDRKVYDAEDRVFDRLGRPHPTVPAGWGQHLGAFVLLAREEGFESAEAYRVGRRRHAAARRKVLAEHKRRTRAIVDAVVASDWWKAAGGPATVSTQMSRSPRGLAFGGWEQRTGRKTYFVRFPLLHRSSAGTIIAHELAHVLQYATVQVPSSEGHGAVFCGVQLRLTELVCGTAYAEALRAEYDEAGIDYDDWPEVDQAEAGLFDQVRTWPSKLEPPRLPGPVPEVVARVMTAGKAASETAGPVQLTLGL